ncbi:polymorphic toxin-type HINT domain-containing protein [Streptomyces sp. NPDC026672]|uniref:polymorphic toxin-type HINT domain-containing protein n=1 Tax=unclassified Streptomyces TaxID=2593676 RepID=UPI0033C6A526
MRVEVARLAETGGPGVSDAAKAALAGGDGKTLATFLHIGQYSKRVADERVVTGRLAETGGAEVQAAAKIALAGPPELIHEFVSTGQYMAQRKDDLATTHVHQVQRLLAEGSLVSAKAQENAWRAAEAAAKAINAAAEAATASAQAQKSADQAAQYAADAKTSANAAAQSAADAAASAVTARSAADRAAQDATAAEDSAADAEFSASYARYSAQQADNSADRARASATAADKSAAEAEAEAKQAWQATRDLADQEMEEALKQAKEERKAQQSNSPDAFCVDLLPFDHSIFPINTVICDHGAIDQAVDVAKDPRTYKAIIWELSGLADIKACIADPTLGDCVMAVVGVTPWGKLKFAAKIGKGVEALKGGRAVRRTVSCLAGAAHSFPVGTKVLLADGTSRPIEQIKPGDLVTATDPTTGETGPRTVTRTIHTPDDRNFTDVTLADGSTLTSTAHHPYWTENDRTWKNASDLKAGDTLRTPNNSTAAIARTRDWQGLQGAYDLTVDDLHTYYVSTGTTNVLVHNTDAACPKWVEDIFDELASEWITTGKIRDDKGNRIPSLPDSIVSMKDEDTAGIQAYLKKIGYGHPKQTSFFGDTHAETKLAYKMLMNDVKDATIVINNNKGVCTGRDSRSVLIENILPVGSTLTAYYPGASTPKVFQGRGPGKI